MNGDKILLAAALVLCTPCLAGDWVVSAYLGGATTDDSSIVIDQPALGTRVRFRDIDFVNRSLDMPLYYGYRAAWFFHPHFGVEGEFIHAKVYTRPLEAADAGGTIRGVPVNGRLPLALVLDRFSISHGLNFLLANFVARHEFMKPPGEGRSPIILSGRFGIGPTVPHAESSFGGRALEGYELGSVALQFAGGAELRLYRGLYLLIEYKHTRTHQRVAIVDGHAQTLLRTNHGVLGFSWHF